MTVTDGSLQVGDIIAIPGGYIRFKGPRADGSNEFEQIDNPWGPRKKGPAGPR